jgi:hypothetical protein
MAVKQNEKVRENLLRRMAARQGLTLHKSRTRDPRALDYGRWYLADKNAVLVGGERMDIDDVEHFLTGDA